MKVDLTQRELNRVVTYIVADLESFHDTSLQCRSVRKCPFWHFKDLSEEEYGFLTGFLQKLNAVARRK